MRSITAGHWKVTMTNWEDHRNWSSYNYRKSWWVMKENVMKSGFYTTSTDQLSGWTEKKLQSTSQSQTCTKKCHSHCLVVCCPSDPLQLSESQRNHYIWDVCSKIDETHCKLQCLQPAFVNRMSPILLHNNAWLHVTKPKLQKLEKLGYKVLCHMPYSPDFLPTDYHFFKHLDNFLYRKCFHTRRR